jgi:hypothetical protein
VADKLLIDLVTVAAYTIGDSRVIVPQRVDPERGEPTPRVEMAPPARPAPSGRYVAGGEDFAASIEGAPVDQRPLLRRLTEWALNLESEGLVRLGRAMGRKVSSRSSPASLERTREWLPSITRREECICSFGAA